MRQPAHPRTLTKPGTAPARPRSIGVALDIHAEREPDRPALTMDGDTLSRRELAARVHRRARTLAAHGVEQGSFVAIVLPNGFAFMELAFAAWSLGATPVPVSDKLPAAEIEAILALVAPRLVVSDHAFPSSWPTLPERETRGPTMDDGPPPEVVAPHMKAIASGGSTGTPKVIVDIAPGLLDPDAPLLGMKRDDVLLNPGPLYHAAPFGMTAYALAWGLHVVLMPRFDAEETLRLIDRHRVTWLYQVPTMMHRIWSLPETVRTGHDISSLDMVLHIAAPCPAWLKEKWIDWVGADTLWEVYTGAEALGGTAINGAEWLEHRGSVGRVLPGFSLRVIDPNGADCAPGEVGEIYFLPDRGQGSTYRYLGAAAKSAGVFETFGDLGHVDAEGWLYLADRRVDLILVGGANVYPAEVEAAIDAFPGVLSSVVVGLPDADLGQRIHAVIEAGDGALDEAALRTFLVGRLARYKLPRSYEFTTERLRDDAGKVRRSAVRAARLG